MTCKILVIQKSLTDEKSLRREAERKLMDRSAPSGANASDYQRGDRSNGYPLNGNSEDLVMMQNQLASMNQRVLNSLQR